MSDEVADLERRLKRVEDEIGIREMDFENDVRRLSDRRALEILDIDTDAFGTGLRAKLELPEIDRAFREAIGDFDFEWAVRWDDGDPVLEVRQ